MLLFLLKVKYKKIVKHKDTFHHYNHTCAFSNKTVISSQSWGFISIYFSFFVFKGLNLKHWRWFLKGLSSSEDLTDVLSPREVKISILWTTKMVSQQHESKHKQLSVVSAGGFHFTQDRKAKSLSQHNRFPLQHGKHLIQLQ